MENSVFTKIIQGEIPCYKIYEDEKTLAFLDIHPIRPGHVLVIPKKQVDHLWDLEAADYQALMDSVKKVAQRMRQVLQPVRVGSHVAGIEVAHAHVHLFPFATAAEFWTKPDPSITAHEAELTAMAKRLAF